MVLGLPMLDMCNQFLWWITGLYRDFLCYPISLLGHLYLMDHSITISHLGLWYSTKWSQANQVDFYRNWISDQLEGIYLLWSHVHVGIKYPTLNTSGQYWFLIGFQSNLLPCPWCSRSLSGRCRKNQQQHPQYIHVLDNKSPIFFLGLLCSTK